MATKNHRPPKPYVSVLIRINYDGWRALKHLALETDSTIQRLGVEALNDMLVKHGKRAIITRGKRSKT